MPSRVKLSEAEGPALQVPPTTMYEMMKTASSQYPHTPALVSMHQPADLYAGIVGSQTKNDYLRWSHSQLERGAELLAVAFRDLGLQQGEAVAVFVNNVAEWSLILYATMLLRVPFVNCNPRSAPNAEEVKHVLKTSGARAVIATDIELARRLEEAAPAEMKSMRFEMLLGNESRQPRSNSTSYLYLGTLLTKAASRPDLQQTLNELDKSLREQDDTVIIFFTSGTTSLPKGCAHTNKTFTSSLRSYKASLSISPESRMVMSYAVNTIIGPLFSFSFLASGATVVHPSLKFDALASIRAIELEKASHMGTVTTMLQLCLEHPSLPSTDVSSLKIVFCGGSNVLYSHATKTRDLMGAKLRIIYGLTEAPASTNGYAETIDEAESTDTDREAPSTGPPAPGVKIRICDPSTGNIVARGERGELHQSGPLIIRQYIGKASPESFYDDAHELWFRTGDEAIMDFEGEIRVTGRFKDLILRGGANLSPAAIENVISRELSMDSQVIGIKDEVAGEVPIAIIKADENQQQHVSAVRQTVVRSLGKNYALERVVLVKDLGLDDWPTTTSGKVQKTKLRDLMADYMASNDHKKAALGASDMAATIKDTWNAVTDVPVQEIKEDTSINELADSLTISRLASQLQEALAQNVSLQDLLDNPTLGEQAKLMESRKYNPLADLNVDRAGPPTIDDMIHTNECEDRALKTKEVCETALEKLGLSWSEDVKDVLPVYDWGRTNLRFGDSHASGDISRVEISNGATVSQLSDAVKTALGDFDMMRTLPIQFDDDTILYVVIRPSHRWYDTCLKIWPEPLDTIDDLKQLETMPSTWGQPLVRVVVAFVKETDSAGVSMSISHATGDGISWVAFNSTIEATLRDEKHTPTAKVPYKMYADEHYAFRSSIRAQALVNKYAKSLNGIRTRTQMYWPPSRESYWFYGCGWSESTRNAPKGFVKDEHEGHVRPNHHAAASYMYRREEVELRDIHDLQTLHEVTPPVLGVAALLLFVATQTQQAHVFLGQFLSGRNQWPAARWIANRLPSALDIDGPTYTCMPYCLKVDQHLKVIDLLKQIAHDNSRLAEDSQLPTFALHRALNDGDEDGPLNYRDGDVMANGLRRLSVNWLPPMSTGDQEPVLTCVRNAVETRLGATFAMGMKADGKTFWVGAYWGDAALDDEEKDNAVNSVGRMASRLCDEANWNRSVGDMMYT